MRISIEINQPRWLESRPRLRKGIMLGVFLGLLVIPGTVIASHQFADVPDNQPFHAQIGAIKDAGITSGSTECGSPPPGQTFYCPESLVRRDAMAAFMHRGYGRVGHDATGGTVFTDGEFNDGASVTLQTGGVSGASGFVLVTGTISTTTEQGGGESCPCQVYMQLRMRDAGTTFDELSDAVFTIMEQITDFPSASISQTWVFPVPTASERQFTVQFRVTGSPTTGIVTTLSSITALYVPFSNDGDNSLS